MHQFIQNITGDAPVNVASPPRVDNFRSVLLAMVATSLACMVSFALKSVDDEIAPIWLTNSVLLAQIVVNDLSPAGL